jgi:hypothetical protein
MPGIEEFYSEFEIQSPIFFSFFGKTPMCHAMDSRDYKSFYILIDFLLKFQDGIKHSYLV